MSRCGRSIVTETTDKYCAMLIELPLTSSGSFRHEINYFARMLSKSVLAARWRCLFHLSVLKFDIRWLNVQKIPQTQRNLIPNLDHLLYIFLFSQKKLKFQLLLHSILTQQKWKAAWESWLETTQLRLAYLEVKWLLGLVIIS